MILGLWYAKSNEIMLCYSWNLVAQSQIFKLNVYHIRSVKGKKMLQNPQNHTSTRLKREQ